MCNLKIGGMSALRLSTTAIGHYFKRALVRHSSQSTTPHISTFKCQVYPFSNIKITSNFHLNIKPYDIIECPDGNLLRISLQKKNQNRPPSKRITELIANFNADVQIDDQNIVIDTIGNSRAQVIADELADEIACLVEVPIKANLTVSSRRDISIQSMYSDDINVTSKDGDITTKNIHSVSLSLITENGSINCEGTTLARKMDIRSNGEKNIHLNKVLGDSLTATSESGIISTNSCYTENSKFTTENGGGLHLKNVHKKSTMQLLNGGQLDVTGFHGILNVNTNGGTLYFQLTEIYGESCIEAQDPTQFNVNISEFVEKHTCLSFSANKIIIDPTLSQFESENNGDGDELHSNDSDINEDSLTIRTNGNLKLGKLSWMDTIKLKLAAQKQDTE